MFSFLPPTNNLVTTRLRFLLLSISAIIWSKQHSNSFKMATRPKVSIDREKIIKINKEVFEEELKKQEVNITNIISSNFTLKR